MQQTEVLRSEENAKQARKAESKAKRETAKAEQLVDARGTHNYKAAAEILYDLREAVGGDEGDKITRRHATHLSKKHPSLSHLKSSLRKRGLLE